MKVILTDLAEADLERIGDAVAKDSPRRAVSYIAELRETCEALAATPKAFPVVGRYAHVAIRRRVHGNYLIFYRLRREAVFVLRILHGAMDYENLLSLRPRGD